MECILILIFKTIENFLSTLRIILVANEKKLLAALLNGLVSLIWIFSTFLLLKNLNKEPSKVICYILGSIIGSYTGCLIKKK